MSYFAFYQPAIQELHTLLHRRFESSENPTTYVVFAASRTKTSYDEFESSLKIKQKDHPYGWSFCLAFTFIIDAGEKLPVSKLFMYPYSSRYSCIALYAFTVFESALLKLLVYPERFPVGFTAKLVSSI